MSESRDRPSQRPDVPVPSRGRVVGGDAAPRPVPEAEVFVFRTVRQSGGGRQLPWGSAHLTLVFDEQGVEISGSRPGERSVVPWAAVTRVSRGASERAPDGGSVTIIGIESPGRIMRFVVTSHRRDPIELAALSEQVQRWSESAGSAVGAPGRSETMVWRPEFPPRRSNRPTPSLSPSRPSASWQDWSGSRRRRRSHPSGWSSPRVGRSRGPPGSRPWRRSRRAARAAGRQGGRGGPGGPGGPPCCSSVWLSSPRVWGWPSPFRPRAHRGRQPVRRRADPLPTRHWPSG